MGVGFIIVSGGQYINGIFFDQTCFAGDLTVPEPNKNDDGDPHSLASKGEIAATLWANTPPVTKCSSIKSGGWMISLCVVMSGMLYFLPGCEQSLCKCLALIMIWWQLVWYCGMLDKIDHDVEDNKSRRYFRDYFWKESHVECILFLVFYSLGWGLGENDVPALIRTVLLGLLLLLALLNLLYVLRARASIAGELVVAVYPWEHHEENRTETKEQADKRKTNPVVRVHYGGHQFDVTQAHDEIQTKSFPVDFSTGQGMQVNVYKNRSDAEAGAPLPGATLHKSERELNHTFRWHYGDFKEVVHINLASPVKRNLAGTGQCRIQVKAKFIPTNKKDMLLKLCAKRNEKSADTGLPLEA